MQVKKGNAITLKVLARDKQGEIITDLGTVSAVLFMVKVNRTDSNDSAIISKSLGDGITVDDPDPGYIKVQLTSSDTLNDPSMYHMGLQLNYPGSENNQEIYLIENNKKTDEFQIIQDIIR